MKNILLFSASFLLSFILLELFVRFAEIECLAPNTIDNTLGNKLVPNRDLIFFNEGFHMGRTNNYGYYGPDYRFIKDSGTIRIALLGDSYVQGFQVFDRDHFRNLVEKKLQELTSKKIEVLNFGMSGFNLEDEYCYFINFVSKFNPDYILFFVSLSDLDTNRTSKDRPYCYIENEHLKISYDFSKSSEFLSRKKGSFYRGKLTTLRLVNNCLELIKKGMLLNILLDKLYPKGNEREQQEEINLTHDNFILSKKVRSILETLPEKRSLIVCKSKLPENIIEEIKYIGLGIIDPSYKLETLKEKGINPNYWKATNKIGHWNQHGHKVVSDVIINNLKSRI